MNTKSDLTKWKMQMLINEAHALAGRSLEARVKRLEAMVENLAEDVFGDECESSTGLGVSGTDKPRFSL